MKIKYFGCAAPLSLLIASAFGQTLGTPKWSFTANYPITACAPIVAADQTIYFSTAGSTMYGVRNNGTAKWAASTPSGYFLGDNSPVMSADQATVYYTYYGKALTARRTSDGGEVWTYYIPNTSNGYPTMAGPAVGPDGTIYFCGYDFNFYAINPNGTLKWSKSLPNGAGFSCSPAIAPDGTIYMGSLGGTLTGFNPDGTQKIVFSTDGGGVESPAIAADGTIYVCGYGGLYAFRPPSTTRIWKYTNTSLQGEFPQAGPSIGLDGTIYFECHGFLYAILANGQMRWQFSTEHTEQNSGYSCPAVAADGTIYVGSPSHKLYAVNPDGTSRWTFTAGDKIYSAPGIGSDGTVYFGSLDQKLYALYGSAPLAESPWPKFHYDARNSGDQQALPCAGLVAWWPVDGTPVDIIGGHNGTLVGSFSFAPAEVNLGLHLNGPSEGMTVPDNSALNFGPGADFSIESWVAPITATTSYGVMDIVDKRITPYYGNDSVAQGYELCVGNGQLAFQMSDSLNSYPLVVSGGRDLRDGVWHHVAVSVQRGSTTGGKLYVDGQVVATFDPTSKPGDLTTTAALLVGMHPSPWLDCNFRGTIDEPSLYNRALTAADVAAIYYAGVQGKPCRQCSLPPSGMLAWWPVDGSAADVVGGNNGSLVGGYTFVEAEVALGLGLSGASQGISVPDNSRLDFGAGANFSIEAWVQPVTATTSYGVMDIVDKRITPYYGDDSAAQGYELCLGNGQLAFQMSDSLGSYPLVTSAGPDLRDNAWHHVAVTVQRNSTTGGTLYVDGQAVGTFDPTSKPGDLSTTAALLIGMHPSPWLDCNFRGTIDEVTLYNRVLTPTEIQTIYVTGSAGKCKP